MKRKVTHTRANTKDMNKMIQLYKNELWEIL